MVIIISPKIGAYFFLTFFRLCYIIVLERMIILSKIIDLIGQGFGKLIVLEKLGTKNGRVVWKCKCDCGNYTEVTTA